MENQLDSFSRHHEKIAKVIVGCIGVHSKQVHWTEVAPMIAAYTNKEIEQEVSAYKEELASLKEENAKLREEKKDLLNALESLSPTVKK